MPHRQRIPQYFIGRIYDLWFESEAQARELMFHHYHKKITGDIHNSKVYNAWALPGSVIDSVCGGDFNKETQIPLALKPFHFKDRS